MLSDLFNAPSIHKAHNRSLEPVILSGKDAIRCSVVRGENMDGHWGGKPKAEFSLLDMKPWGTVRTYDFSILIPGSWKNTNTLTCVFDCHSYPDADDVLWPPQPLVLYIQNDTFRWAYSYDVNKQTVVKPTFLWLGKPVYYVKDVETDWKVEVRFAFDDTGFINIWRNGQFFLSHTGPNCMNDAKSPYATIGLYEFDWSHSENSRELYLTNWNATYL
jgi:hypothetical protein